MTSQSKMRVLSAQECDTISYYLSQFQSRVKAYFENLENAINVFNQNEIVQSFYESGNFGQEMQTELLKIQEAVQEYFDTINGANGVVPLTRQTISSHKNLLNASFKGVN